MTRDLRTKRGIADFLLMAAASGFIGGTIAGTASAPASTGLALMAPPLPFPQQADA